MNKYEKARRIAFLTQEQAAKIFGVTRQTVTNWERNICKPSRDDVIEVYKTWGKQNASTRF